jgi:hypothetical protein
MQIQMKVKVECKDCVVWWVAGTMTTRRTMTVAMVTATAASRDLGSARGL